VKLVIPDGHEGIKTAVSEVLNATWQRHIRERPMTNRWPGLRGTPHAPA